MNAKKQARRNAAASRFNILTLAQWDSMRFQQDLNGRCPDRRRSANIETIKADYDAYVARKHVERIALGL